MKTFKRGLFYGKHIVMLMPLIGITYIIISFYNYLTHIFALKLWSKYKMYWFSHINIF